MNSKIGGVEFHGVQTHEDGRGCLTEIFRNEWFPELAILQWNVVQSRANVMRGFHLHVVHDDVLTVLSGSLLLGLHDLRPTSATYGVSDVIRIHPFEYAVRIPVGVGHLFCFDEDSLMAYGVTEYWSESDELGCRWDDPDLNFNLPVTQPILSLRDSKAGSLSLLKTEFSKQFSATLT